MKRKNTWIVPTIVAVILGIIIGILFFTGTIGAAFIGVPVIFATIFAAIALILLFVVAAFAERREVRECVDEYGITLIVGTVGTLITTFFALTVLTLLAAGIFIAALLIAVFIFFFILTVITFVQLIVCLVENIDGRKKDYCKFENDYNR